MTRMACKGQGIIPPAIHAVSARVGEGHRGIAGRCTVGTLVGVSTTRLRCFSQAVCGTLLVARGPGQQPDVQNAWRTYVGRSLDTRRRDRDGTRQGHRVGLHATRVSQHQAHGGAQTATAVSELGTSFEVTLARRACRHAAKGGPG